MGYKRKIGRKKKRGAKKQPDFQYLINYKKGKTSYQIRRSAVTKRPLYWGKWYLIVCCKETAFERVNIFHFMGHLMWEEEIALMAYKWFLKRKFTPIIEQLGFNFNRETGKYEKESYCGLFNEVFAKSAFGHCWNGKRKGGILDIPEEDIETLRWIMENLK